MHEGHHAHLTHHGTAAAPHDKHAGHTPEIFRRRLVVSLLLTLPILYFSHELQQWLRFEAVRFPGSEWVTPVFAVVLYAYGGWVFIEGAWQELRARAPGMMALVAMAITVAFVYSLAVTFGLRGMPFYWELATLVDVMLLGHWLEMLSIQGASRALEHLAILLPQIAHRLKDGRVEDVPVTELAEGDRILVRPGEQIPADGTVVDGASNANEAFLTGESRPVLKETGSEVVAGSVNGEGALTVVVRRTGDRTTLSQIMRLVQEAQASRSRFQALADRAAYYLTLIAIVGGALTFFAWLSLSDGGDLNFALTRAVTVLVIACPHALGLAIPLVVVSATAVSARNGILVRNREAFERARALRIVAFDKTGTLTEGRFGVREVYSDGLPKEHALRLAAGLETRSEHPLARAIVDAAQNSGLTPDAVEEFRVLAGRGVEGRLGGRTYRIGRPEWAVELDLSLSPALKAGLEEAESRGESVVVLMDEQRVLALVALADRVRESARQAIHGLHGMGIEIVMITGDAEAVAKTVARELGIVRFYARVLPQDKSRLVGELKRNGPVAFVGDGINDAPALLEADLGIAIGAGTNVAIESADLVLVENDPLDVVRAIRLARATYGKMVQNLLWATGYNAVALPLAAGVAASWGILLSPALGALFMSLSTVIVAVNAVLLRRLAL
jgi:Cu2+-exporting ATPase